MEKIFVGFPKIARLAREIVISEKIDGTNGCIRIGEDGTFLVGSRTRWLTPETGDNHGFLLWAMMHKEELLTLGVGTHFGEWFGAGIQRGYGLQEKRFALFNTSRWTDNDKRPACCHVVPTLWRGIFNMQEVDNQLNILAKTGSKAAPGYAKPEGVIIFHTAQGVYFKKTIEKDDACKGIIKNDER